ncbi:MAG: signal peptidase I [Candidatus Nealsonbacteria bacterium]
MVQISKPILTKIGKYSLIFLGIALILGVGFYFWQSYDTKVELAGKDTSCLQIEEHNIAGHSMYPLLQDGTRVKGLEGYYDCNPIEKDQIVILEFKSREETFVKRIAGVPGDELVFQGSQAKLNGEILKNSVGEPYLFSAQAQRIITIPLKDGKIPEGRYFILSEEKGPTSFDSRQFGFVQKESLTGRVIK